MSTPYACPPGVTRFAERSTSSPAPLPRSSTRSPGRRSARSVGFPQPRLAVGSIPTDASSAAEYVAPQVSSRSEEHTSELQSPDHLVCRLLLEKKKQKQ